MRILTASACYSWHCELPGKCTTWKSSTPPPGIRLLVVVCACVYNYCYTCHMTVKYLMMYPSMVGSVQCDVTTKGCLLCVCVSTSKLVTVRCYCSLLVLCLFSSTWCTLHKQGPSGSHKEDMVCHIHSQPQHGTSVHHQCLPLHLQALLRPCPGTHTWCDNTIDARTPATLRTPMSILRGTGLFLVP